MVEYTGESASGGREIDQLVATKVNILWGEGRIEGGRDQLADHMKYLESQTTLILPRRTYAIIRIDGKCFHTFTRRLSKPYDEGLAQALDAAAIALCKEAMGTRLAYGQSDEYSFLLTDFQNENTEAWFGGNVQKIVSVAASIFTAEFNAAFGDQGRGLATFDARVFALSSPSTVRDYFAWRQHDAMRNSVSMLASCYFSGKTLIGRGTRERLTILQEKGIDWAISPPVQKWGRTIRKGIREQEVTWTHKRTGEMHTETHEESYWYVDTTIPIFTEDRDYLEGLIPCREIE